MRIPKAMRTFLSILKGDTRPDYFVVPSPEVARIHRVDPAKTGSIWYSVHQKDIPGYAEAWSKVFGESAADSLTE